ncbi:MAG: hypothetical protein ABFS09_06065 [Thermodesulfobacteriota bacterium]
MLHGILSYGFLVGALFFLSGCGQVDRPFEYRYENNETVVITYQGSSYELVNNAPVQPDVPFTYEFEADGDLDIIIAGRSYEIENPYDRDSVVKKKKSAKKTFTRKKSSRRR